MSADKIKIALIGNPNIGKTTLFNTLCGLNQKTGNYAGVTVERKTGRYTFLESQVIVEDLPGINSIYPKSEDEELVYKFLTNEVQEELPDKIILVVSALNLKRNLYLFHQIKDFNIPIILAVNMVDVSANRGVKIDYKKLGKSIGCEVIPISAKTGAGIDDLKSIVLFDTEVSDSKMSDYQVDIPASDLLSYCHTNNFSTPYLGFLDLVFNKRNKEIGELSTDKVNAHKLRVNESILRYKAINAYYDDVIRQDTEDATDFTSRIDRVLIHRVWGYVIFISLMFLVFQSIFSLASYPMEWIDSGIVGTSKFVGDLMPAGYLNDLVSNGLIPGIGGVVIFIPQIAILFLLFSLLEESGYMTRVVFLLDKVMQKFGMSGKSVLPLVSGLACAVPSIMGTRTIENKKERLITILVIPLLTCSARIPIYVILVSLIVPDIYYGPIKMQGIAMLGMYLIGVFGALIAGFVFKFILKSKHKSELIMEMPQYLWPSLKNVAITVWTKSLAFVIGAGKIIVATSIILFVLATNGGDKFESAEEIVVGYNMQLDEAALKNEVSSYRLEHSYLGYIGKAIEPAIKPLGYDWKVGVAIVSSLAAREVFVGTMAIIYNIDSEDEMTIKESMQKEINKNTGLPTFNFATAMSLLLFYAFALQCFSTIAVTYKETKSVKWTAVQFLYMTIFAYLIAMLTYQLLS